MMRFTCGACARGMHEHCAGTHAPPSGMMGGSECTCKGGCGPQHPAPEDKPVIEAMRSVLSPENEV